MSLFKKKEKGFVFVISAPSGAGKTTLTENLVEKYQDFLARVITCTTRKPRGTEKNGVDYRFLSEDEFKSKVDNGEFIENQSIYGHSYGTLKSDIDSTVNSGKHALTVIDVQGASVLIEKESVISIFLMPPSFEELENRIRNRDLDDEKAIELRLSKAKGEMEQVVKYDFVVTNEKIEEAVMILQSIIVATEHKQK